MVDQSSVQLSTCPNPVSDLSNRVKSGWMYDWMVEMRHMEDWWKSVEDDFLADLDNTFSFRESKIHLLKKIRDKLHRIQTLMVIQTRK